MEIVGNHCNIKLVSTCYLASEVNYHVTKLFSKKLKWRKAIEMNKTKVKMEKPIYLGFCNVGLKKKMRFMSFNTTTSKNNIIMTLNCDT